MMQPNEVFEAYRLLIEALGKPLSYFCYYEDKENNLLRCNLDYDISKFSKCEQIQLLRLNMQLQLILEQLTAVIEYVPFFFHEKNIKDPTYKH